MSLEQALADNTAAIRELIGKIGGVVSTPAPAPAPAATTKPKKGADKLPGEAPGAANEGDAEGTRYFHNQKHDSVYRIAPADPQVLMPNSAEITGAAFLEHQVRLRAASTALSAATAQTAVQSSSDVNLFDEPEAKVAVTSQVLTDKLRELHKAKGNVALLPILEAVGAKNVQSIPEGKRQDVYDAAVKALAA